MNKLIIAVTTIFILSKGFSQTRVDERIVEIKKNIRTLPMTNGYLKNYQGIWLSGKGKIPSDLEKNSILLNYDEYGLGTDNYLKWEYRTVVIKNVEYGLLLRFYNSGYYRYKAIHKGWIPTKSVSYFAFELSEFEKMDSVDISGINLFKIAALYSGAVDYDVLTNAYRNVELDMQSNILKSNTTFDNDLNFYFKAVPGNKVQFLFQETNRSGFALNDKLDFDKGYYEIDKSLFCKFLIDF